jgi:hypothetical protein
LVAIIVSRTTQELLAASFTGTRIHGCCKKSGGAPVGIKGDFFDLFVFFADDPMFLIPTTESSS